MIADFACVLSKLIRPIVEERRVCVGPSYSDRHGRVAVMIHDGGGGVCGVRGIDIDVDGEEIRARQRTSE
jgi:hypothetical protein